MLAKNDNAESDQTASSVFLANRRHILGIDLYFRPGNILEFVEPVLGLGFRHVLGQILGAVLQGYHRLRLATGQHQQGRCGQRKTQGFDVHVHLSQC